MQVELVFLVVEMINSDECKTIHLANEISQTYIVSTSLKDYEVCTHVYVFMELFHSKVSEAWH